MKYHIKALVCSPPPLRWLLAVAPVASPGPGVGLSGLLRRGLPRPWQARPPAVSVAPCGLCGLPGPASPLPSPDPFPDPEPPLLQNLRLVSNIVSGHTGNIFCGKFVPCANNSLIVSCALDGCVRLTDVQRHVVHCIVRYEQRVHKVAFLPQSPNVFLTAGSDGTVRLFDLRRDSNRHVKVLPDARSPGKC